MKFKLWVFIPLLFIIIFSIGAFYFKSQNSQTVIDNNAGGRTFQEATNNNAETNGNKAVSNAETVNYDGTYTGTFNYEYQDIINTYPGDTVGPWTPASFTLTITLKTVGKSYSTDPDPYTYLDVTNAIVSDPAFGTGSGGVNPVGDKYDTGEQSAWLPLNPAKQDAGASYLSLYFPNMASIVVPWGIRHYAGGNSDLIYMKVSSDGKTISNNPDWVNPDPECTGNPCGAWQASTPSKGNFHSSTAISHRYKYGNWTLTKISP